MYYSRSLVQISANNLLTNRLSNLIHQQLLFVENVIWQYYNLFIHFISNLQPIKIKQFSLITLVKSTHYDDRSPIKSVYHFRFSKMCTHLEYLPFKIPLSDFSVLVRQQPISKQNNEGTWKMHNRTIIWNAQ